MSYLNIGKKLMENVSDEGEILNEMPSLLFSSFNDPNVWSPFNIDCAMPNSSFYIAKINSKLSIINVNATNDDNDDNAYLVVRYTKDNIEKYLDYLKFEYQSYMDMESQVNEIISPIGYVPKISQEGFCFAFLTSTNFTLDNAINSIKGLPLETKFSYVINLINTVNDALTNDITGFHITPKTILLNLQNNEASIGLIGFIGGIENLKLCPTAVEFLYNEEFSPAELKKGMRPKIRAPNSISDVYGLAKIVQFIISDELQIPTYKKAMTSALQKSQNNRLSLNDFLNQMLDAQKEASSLVENPVIEPSSKKPEKKKDRLIDKIIGSCTPLTTKEGFPQIYKLPQHITKTYTNKEIKLRKVTVESPQNSDKEELRILIVGSTGSGKTTFLNGIANYLYGIEWDDNIRLKLVSEGDDCNANAVNNQAVSQTDFVTSYTFYWQPGFPIPYTVTLVDTPGFGDTRGVDVDNRIIDQLQALFKNEGDCGIDSLNAVAFVVQSSLPRLNAQQKYVFDSIQKLFGKDIKDNFVIVATFADSGEPNVLVALHEAQIEVNYLSKFNNSALFAKNSGDSNSKMNSLYWEIGQAGYESIFTNVSKLKQKSLTLTQSVLDERKKLYISIKNLNEKIREGIDKMNQIEQQCTFIEKYKTLIEQNKNFTISITVTKWKEVELSPGTYVTNCIKCNRTCHDDCVFSDNEDKKYCGVMDRNGNCNNCGCHWSIHRNMSFKFVPYTATEYQTSEELKQQFGDATKKKQSSEEMLENAKNEYKQIWDQTSEYLTTCKKCVDKLQEIALKPITLSEIDYINIQIQSEKANKQEGYLKRIEWLEQLLQLHRLIGDIYQGKDILPEQKIITHAKHPKVLEFVKNIFKKK